MSDPIRVDPAMHLVTAEQQITTPHVQPLPPVTVSRRLWTHFGRIAPGLVTTAASALAWAWHSSLPDGSQAPLWISGALSALGAVAGTVSAGKQHGDRDITRLSYAASGTLALVGVAAWTPDWPLRALLWLLSTAAVYAVCAPLWRQDRQAEREQVHERLMEETRGRTQQAVAAIEGQTRIAEAQWQYRTEVARVEAISRTVNAMVEATNARAARAIEPGEELSVAALLKAAGHEAPPVELSAAEREELER